MANGTHPAKQLYHAVRGYLAAREDPLVQRMMPHLPSSPMPRELPARIYPVTDHLPQARHTHDPDADVVVETLLNTSAWLHWGQTYGEADFGPDFLNNYAYMEILGARGHFHSDEIACGFLMIGPETDYPAHHHEAAEIYIVAAGTAAWRKGASGYIKRAPGTLIHHSSQVPHATRTKSEALLALYIWHGGDLAQKSEIGDGP
jgi:hypothetical protein